MVTKISKPAAIAAPGSKIIEEYVGRERTDTDVVSVAHMVAPPGWTEPYQRPEFDEITIVVKGRLRVDHAGGHEVMGAGEVVHVTDRERVRYSNPFPDSAEYWAICLPAFDPKTVHREA